MSPLLFNSFWDKSGLFSSSVQASKNLSSFLLNSFLGYCFGSLSPNLLLLGNILLILIFSRNPFSHRDLLMERVWPINRGAHKLQECAGIEFWKLPGCLLFHCNTGVRMSCFQDIQVIKTGLIPQSSVDLSATSSNVFPFSSASWKT